MNDEVRGLNDDLTTHFGKYNELLGTTALLELGTSAFRYTHDKICKICDQ